MSSTETTHRSAFVAASLLIANNLATSLESVSDAEAVAILATIAATRRITPDIVYLYRDPQEALDIEAILDGHLTRSQSVPHAWRINGHAHLSLVCLTKPGVPL